jgi:hypothetical protein
MNPKAIIVANKREPFLNKLFVVLDEHKIECQGVIHSRKNLQDIDMQNFKGFFIFCIPPSEIKDWLTDINNRYLDYFKIYNYNYLREDNLLTSVFLYFDFIIAGEQENGILHRQIDFLKSNFWRKIPLSKIGLKKVSDSNLIWELFKLLERIDLNSTSFDKLSKKLNVSKETLRTEINKSLKMQYSELKSFILKYYKENFPERIY